MVTGYLKQTRVTKERIRLFFALGLAKSDGEKVNVTKDKNTFMKFK